MLQQSALVLVLSKRIDTYESNKSKTSQAQANVDKRRHHTALLNMNSEVFDLFGPVFVGFDPG